MCTRASTLATLDFFVLPVFPEICSLKFDMTVNDNDTRTQEVGPTLGELSYSVLKVCFILPFVEDKKQSGDAAWEIFIIFQFGADNCWASGDRNLNFW